MLSAEDAGCFTVTWTIENYSLLLGSADSALKSPIWKTDTIEESAWWILFVAQSDSTVIFYQYNIKGNTELDRYEMFLNTSCDKNPLIFSMPSPFRESNWVSSSIERNSLLGDSSQSLFSNDTLTLCCKMWKKTMKAGEYHHRSVLHTVNYIWNREKFEFFDLFFTGKSNLMLYIAVQRKDETDTCRITVGSVPGDTYVYIVDCNLSIIEGLGQVINEKSIYPYITWRCDIENFAEKTKGGFRFKLECIVAVNNVSYSSGTLNNDLLKIYKEKTLSDVILTTEGKAFSAHRSILAARSPVFGAMFKNDQMSEGQEGVAVIEDVDSATLGRMLVFLYGDSLEKVNCEEASALYYAADKYDIPNLKKKCADVLKAGLALDNACQTLILADTHSDQELMKCAFDFIRNHQEVISSAEWEKMEESNPKLAFKCFHDLLGNKRRA